MTDIKCVKRKCLNNKDGRCTAAMIEYDGLCQSYITMSYAAKATCGIVRREGRRLKRKGSEVVK